MPRDGSGIYAPPAGTTATSGTSIESAKYNAFISDLTADANNARPIVAGGTGATTASAARTALGAQASNAALTSIAALSTAADKGIYTTASNTYATFDLTVAGRALLDDADAAAQRTTLGLGAAATESIVPLSKGGTGAALVDPNADRILFWDDSTGAVAFLTAGSGLTISGTTITAGGGAWTTTGTTSIASGTSSDVVVPSTATQMVIDVVNLSLSGTDDCLLRLLDGGVAKTTGYVSASAFDGGSNAISSSGFRVRMGAPARIFSGQITLDFDTSLNVWRIGGILVETSSGVSSVSFSGYCTNVTTLSGVRLLPISGNFDGGSGTIAVTYR